MQRGERQIEAARKRGYSESEIFEAIGPKYEAALNAGLARQDIDRYFGFPNGGLPGGDEDMKDALIRAGVGVSGESGTAGEKVDDLPTALKHGWKQSIFGMLANQDLPSTEIDEDTSTLSKIVATGTTFAFDIPWYFAGGSIGAGAGLPSGPGAIITGTGGAFAFHAAVRKVLMDRYRHGEISDFQEFWERLTGAGVEAAKGEALGLAVGAVGVAGVAGKFSKEFIAAAEIMTILKLGPAMEGVKGPSKDEIIQTAVLIGGMKFVGGFNPRNRATAKLMNIYEKLGVLPRDLARRSVESPSIIDDIQSSNIEIPVRLRGKGRDSLTKEAVEAHEARVDAAKADAKTAAEAKVKQAAEKRSKQLGVLERRLNEAELSRNKAKVKSTKAAIDEVKRVRELERKDKAEDTATDNPISDMIGGKPKVEPSPFTWYQKMYQRRLDSAHPIGIAMDTARRVWAGEGRLTDITEDAYVQFRLLSGAVGKAERALEFNTIDFKTQKPNGESLNTIFKDIASNDKALTEFDVYATSRRVLEKEAQGINTGFNVKSAKKWRDKLESKDMSDRFDAAVAYSDRMLQYLVDAGVIRVETAELMRAQNKDFTPWARLKSGEEAGPRITGSQLVNPVKRMTGSKDSDPIASPLESLVKNTYVFTQMAEVNAARRSFVDAMTEAGLTQFAERVRDPVRSTRLSEKEQIRIIKKHLEKKNEGKKLTKEELAELKEAVDGAMDVFRTETRPPGSGEFVVYRDGVRELWKSPPEIIEAMAPMDASTQNIFVKVLALPAATLRAGAVITPEFISRNILRDQVVAFIYSATRPGRGFIPFVDFYRGWRSLMNKDLDYQEWVSSGGMMAHLTAIDELGGRASVRKVIQDGNLYTDIRNNVRGPSDLARAMARPVKREFRDLRDMGVSKQAGKHIAGQPLRPLRTLTQVMENSSRLGEFKILTAKARKEGRETTLAEIQEAGLASREITLDFGRRGSRMMAWNLISAFFNARLQGIDKMGRSLDPTKPEQFAKVLGRTTAMITIPSLLLHLANRDDPDYWKLPPFARLHFWNFKTEDDNGNPMWVRAPKPFDQGVIFGSGAEHSLEYILTKDPEAADDLLLWLAETTKSLAPLPTGLVPIIDSIAGEDQFTGRPQYPMSTAKLLPEHRATDYTLESTKAFARFVAQTPMMQHDILRNSDALSPAVWENYVRDWTGGAGFYVLEAMDKALREAGVVPDPPRANDTWSDLPFFKGFVLRHGTAMSRPTNEFFAKTKRNAPFYATYRHLLRQGDPDAAKVLWDTHADKMFTMNELAETISGLGTYGRMVDKHPTMDGGEKRQIIDLGVIIRANIAEIGNRQYEIFEKSAEIYMEEQRRQMDEGELEGPSMGRLIQEAESGAPIQEIDVR